MSLQVLSNATQCIAYEALDDWSGYCFQTSILMSFEWNLKRFGMSMVIPSRVVPLLIYVVCES